MLYLDPGTEKWVDRARKLAAELRAACALRRVPTLTRLLVPEVGTLIYVRVHESGEVIRITGGGAFKYIVLVSVPPGHLAPPPAPAPYSPLPAPALVPGSIGWTGATAAYFHDTSGYRNLYTSLSFAYKWTDSYGAVHSSTGGQVSFPWPGIYPTPLGNVFGTNAVQVTGGSPDNPPTFNGLTSWVNPVVSAATIPAGTFGDLDAATAAYTSSEAARKAASSTAQASYYAAITAALAAQLGGLAVPTSFLHDDIYGAFPKSGGATAAGLADKTVVDFYYVTTNSSLHSWGAFGVPPENSADGDEDTYLVPVASVAYDAAGRQFLPRGPAVLRDPVRAAHLATWDWKNLPATSLWRRPSGSPKWSSFNVVAVFHPLADKVSDRKRADGSLAPARDATYAQQELDIQRFLDTYPLASSADGLRAAASATKQPANYPVKAPVV